MKILYGQQLVKSLRAECDGVSERLWIAVPYIGNLRAIKNILGKKWFEDPRVSFKLITDVNEISNFNSESIEFFKKHGDIKHLVGLHAKLYIIDNKCLLTSANLTSTAFTKRHEVGVMLDGIEAQDAIKVFKSMWLNSEASNLEKIKLIESRRGSSDEEKEGVKYPVLWKLPETPEESNYWLKPIGSTESPITEKRNFSKSQTRLHFSKRMPRSVKVNDILIAYGVGAKRVLSVYKVLDVPAKLKEKDFLRGWHKRWPWYVRAKNLTKTFGRDWVKHSLFINELVKEYLSTYPNRNITKVGGITLGALNYKQDKVNLDPKFAQFIIDKIYSLQDQ